jgi:hypothetical protein
VGAGLLLRTANHKQERSNVMPNPMHFLIDGHADVTSWPGKSHDQAYVISNDYLLNYKLTVDDGGVTELLGSNTLVKSSLTVNTSWTVANYGTLNLQNNSSFVDHGNLTGTGAIIANKSSVTIAGPSQTSETISLVNHSNLYLGVAPGMEFMAPITSTIHLTNDPLGWINATSGHGWGQLDQQTPGLINGVAVVHSSTPGYAPQLEILSSGGHESGLIIVDKPNMGAPIHPI